jgi:hypothetical protein
VASKRGLLPSSLWGGLMPSELRARLVVAQAALHRPAQPSRALPELSLYPPPLSFLSTLWSSCNFRVPPSSFSCVPLSRFP